MVRYKIYDSYTRLRIVLSISACLAVMGGLAYAAVVLSRGHRSAGQTAVAAALYLVVPATALVVGGVLMLPTLRVVFRIPLLSLDSDGVVLHSVRLKVRWSDIDEIVKTRLPGVDNKARCALLFSVVDDQAVLRDVGRLAGKVAAAGMSRYDAPMWVYCDDFSIPIDDVIAAIERISSIQVRIAD